MRSGVNLLEPDVGEVAAVAGVPAERRAPKPPGFIYQKEDDLERVREGYELQLCRRGQGGRRVAGVEGPAKT